MTDKPSRADDRGPDAGAHAPAEAPAPVALGLLVRASDAGAPAFALALAGTAVAADDPVCIALFGPSVAAWLGAARAGDASFARELALVRAMADVSRVPFEVLACSAAVDELGEDPEALEDSRVVDGVLGWPAIWRRLRTRQVVVV